MLITAEYRPRLNLIGVTLNFPELNSECKDQPTVQLKKIEQLLTCMSYCP